jgi:hypothetical protein
MCKNSLSKSKIFRREDGQCPNFDQDKVNTRFPIQKFFPKEMNKDILDDLFKKEKMTALISKR